MHGSGMPPHDPADPTHAPPPGGFGAPRGGQVLARFDPNPLSAKQVADNQRGAKLVSTSTWILLGGLFLMFGGCGSAMFMGLGSLAIACVATSIVVIIIAAVVGQVGRALQGRVL